jgi:hypothetical protein
VPRNAVNYSIAAPIADKKTALPASGLGL